MPAAPPLARLRALACSAVVCAAAAACSSGTPSPAPADPPPGTEAPPAGVALPPPGGPFDYQIGEPYPPEDGTAVVARDRQAEPAPGLYNICYVNAFQAQPHELGWWKENHPDVLLRDDAGAHVVDTAWDEVLLDITTGARREALAGVVGGWIDGCAAAGFDAVEPDNLDSYTRSQGLVSQGDAAAFATLLAGRAHAAGLAIAQKNDTDLPRHARPIGFDFAVVEECGRWDECDAYTAVYGDRVYVIEYRDRDFAAACEGWPELSVVRRDRDVTAPGSPGYRYAVC
jgi:hypothetical protein